MGRHEENDYKWEGGGKRRKTWTRGMREVEGTQTKEQQLKKGGKEEA